MNKLILLNSIYLLSIAGIWFLLRDDLIGSLDYYKNEGIVSQCIIIVNVVWLSVINVKNKLKKS